MNEMTILVSGVSKGEVYFIQIMGSELESPNVWLYEWREVVAIDGAWGPKINGRTHVTRALAKNLAEFGNDLVGVQMILGFAAFFAVRATRDAPRPSLTEVLITSAHHVVGALLLACSALVLVFVYRLLTPGEKISQIDE